ncbi:acetyltransferase (GNAT) family protein [Gallaecimonas pentaromativorans]|uniref:Acetyltransferase (GNAT) family protein n=2 Tax=Gallaecimonas pentaromativorans TaxID=584787 RepID=A0A3N1NUT0_9GAMM|nr:acetyltransferase (GNAT) family protein [Gallaecimonas pentaromativorans]
MELMPLTDAHWPALSRLPNCSALWSPCHREYYRQYFQRPFVDHSLAVVHQGELAGVLLATLDDRQLGFFGGPARLLIAPGLAEARKLEAERLLTKAFSAEFMDKASVLSYQFPAKVPDGIATALLDAGATTAVHFEQEIALGDDDVLWSGVRKSYRQGVRWGQQNLELRLVDATNLDVSDMERFRLFHERVAGRATRSLSSWQAQQKLIADNEAFAVFASLDGQLVAASLFLCGASRAYYGVGVYDRDRFNLPISHYPLYAGLQRARERGCTVMDMGPIAFAGDGDPKLAQIGLFKRGFGGDLQPWLCLSLAR